MSIAEVLQVVNVFVAVMMALTVFILNGLRQDVREVKKQTTLTNGRVTALETWRAAGIEQAPIIARENATRIESVRGDLERSWSEIEKLRRAVHHDASVLTALFLAVKGKLPTSSPEDLSWR